MKTQTTGQAMEEEKPRQPWDKRLVFHWTAVFLVNMPLPWLFGGMVVKSHWGQGGMALGCLCVYAIGFFFAGRGHTILRMITWGGWLVALLQCVVVLHMIVGILAEGIWGKFASLVKIPDDGFDFLKGYTMTLLVGQMLIATSFAFGVVIYSIIKGFGKNGTHP